MLYYLAEMASFCSLCDCVTVALGRYVSTVLIAIIRTYIHSPLTIDDHAKAINNLDCEVSCFLDRGGQYVMATNVDAITYSTYSGLERVYLAVSRVTIGGWFVPLSIIAEIYHEGVLSDREAEAFPWYGPDHLVIEKLKSPYITDEFFDNLLDEFPRMVALKLTIAAIRSLIAEYYTKVLYGPAHGLPWQ